MSSFICSPRVLDCYRLCAPPTFSYLEIEHPVVDCLRYEWNLPLPRPTSCTPEKIRTSTLFFRGEPYFIIRREHIVLPAGLKPATLGLEIPCSIQLSYESIKLIISIISSGPRIRTWTSNYCLEVMSLTFYHYTNPQFSKNFPI